MPPAILSFLAAWFLRFLRCTWRVRLTGFHPVDETGPVVFCFWHGVQAGLFAYRRPGRVAVMSSLSRDGELQARILARLGYTVTRGSSSRSGAAGLKGLIDLLRAGCDAAITVDGPRGPVYQAKPGAAEAAKAGGAMLVPITMAASRAWVFQRSWDRYTLPKPFATVTITVGQPLDPYRTSPSGLGDALLALEH